MFNLGDTVIVKQDDQTIKSGKLVRIWPERNAAHVNVYSELYDHTFTIICMISDLKQGWAKKELDKAKKEWDELPYWVKPLFQIKK